MERISLCLNTDDPAQKELYEFVTLLPNGKKRNSSAFLKMLVDREYQKRKEEFLAEMKKIMDEKKTQEASLGEVVKTPNGGIKYELNKKLSD